MVCTALLWFDCDQRVVKMFPESGILQTLAALQMYGWFMCGNIHNIYPNYIQVDDYSSPCPPLKLESVKFTARDAWMQASLLQALHRTVKDGMLPQPASSLWSSHILPARRADWTLDLKASSHKKISKLLQVGRAECILKTSPCFYAYHVKK